MSRAAKMREDDYYDFSFGLASSDLTLNYR
jgi:hypothetical protein